VRRRIHSNRALGNRIPFAGAGRSPEERFESSRDSQSEPFGLFSRSHQRCGSLKASPYSKSPCLAQNGDQLSSYANKLRAQSVQPNCKTDRMFRQLRPLPVTHMLHPSNRLRLISYNFVSFQLVLVLPCTPPWLMVLPVGLVGVRLRDSPQNEFAHRSIERSGGGFEKQFGLETEKPHREFTRIMKPAKS
jgi:hypothetical protein